jgi:hypothetical protein
VEAGEQVAVGQAAQRRPVATADRRGAGDDDPAGDLEWGVGQQPGIGHHGPSRARRLDIHVIKARLAIVSIPVSPGWADGPR